jgi:hypothetical protein
MRKTILNSITCGTFYEPQKSGCALLRRVLTAVSAAQEVFRGLFHISIYIFKRLERWHFDNHFYLAVFKTTSANILIPVATISKYT